MRACILGFLFLQLLHVQILAQPVSANFTIPVEACLGERVSIQNQSTGSNRYEWDFCQGDLDLSPVASVVDNLSGNITTGIDVVFDGVNWYGFVTSRDANSILRLDFGVDIQSKPTIVNLGNISNVILKPIDIKVVFDGGNWYGFVYGQDDPKITRIDFWSSLSNTTSSVQPITATAVVTGAGTTNGGFDIVNNGIEWIIVSVQSPSFEIFKLNTINSIPSALNKITGIANPFGTSLGDLTIHKFNGSYFGYISAYGSSKLLRLNFGTNLFTSPTIDDISSILPTGSTPYGIDGGIDDGNYYLFISTLEGNLLKINLGVNLASSPVSGTDLGLLSVLSNSLKVKLVKRNSRWFGFLTDFSSTNLFRVDFPTPSACPGNLVFSEDIVPKISYNVSGATAITLRSYNDGYFEEAHKKILINNKQAPSAEFTTQNICKDNPVNFSATNPGSNVIQYNWDFGDSNSSSGPSPIASNIYSSNGQYQLSLKVASSDGCFNKFDNTITIRNPPTASFTLPTGLICTNNEFTFTNNTIDNFEGNLTYQWFVDNNQEATTRDLKYSFLAVGNKVVKLIASIPGCFSESTQALNNVQTGPTVGFEFTGKCQNELVQFTNNSSGDISSYLWDLGNGQTSTSTNVSQTYPAFGNYNVSLQSSGTNGCISTTSKLIKIYSVPQSDFSLDLPPFSCSGTPSQFNDLTPGPTDSNLSQWNWSFGDAAIGISTIKNPTYTYTLAGSYNVSLKATTNFGCTATKIKTVQIAQSPKPDFSIVAACLNQPTYFTDASGANNKSWLWKVGNSSYTLQNPTHVFSGVGNFTAQLTVIGNNDCIAVTSKPIIVPLPPVLDFTSQNNCAGQATIFKNVTSVTTDPAVSHTWDFAGKGNGSGASTQFAFASPGTYSVKMMVTNQSGCNYALTKNTSIVTSPIADFSLSPESGPPPHVVQFTNVSKNASSYKWKFNDLNNSVSLLETPIFTYTTLGDFIVDLSASNAQGCVDIKSKFIHVITPRTEMALEGFTLLHDAKTGAVRPVLTIKNNSNYTISNMEVVLDVAGNALVSEKISTTILPNASASQILNYELLPGRSTLDYLCAEIRLTDDRLSDDTDEANNSACISLASTEVLFPPYPNPVQEQLRFDWIAATEGSGKVSVVTQMGQVAFQQEVDNIVVGLNKIVLDLATLNSGFYMLIFESAESRKTFPFVIQQ